MQVSGNPGAVQIAAPAGVCDRYPAVLTGDHGWICIHSEKGHLGLVRSIAMVELLIAGWCEPPAPMALHLSTLTHQVLSVIAEHGGVKAKRLFMALCSKGPFQRVDSRLFARLLRQLGSSEVALIEQAPDGTLLLGHQGERLVEYYRFYAVFQTPEEYRIIADRKPLGTLPIVMVLTPGMTIIFSGRRWRITEIHDREKVIQVTADQAGRPPRFGGGGGLIHDRVVGKMLELLSNTYLPAYIDECAAHLLEDARSEFRRLDMARKPIHRISERSYLMVTSAGTVKTSTLALVLRDMGYVVEVHDGFLSVKLEKIIQPLEDTLKTIASAAPNSLDFTLPEGSNLITEKFYSYLSPELLLEDAVSSRLDFDALPKLAQRIMIGTQ